LAKHAAGSRIGLTFSARPTPVNDSKFLLKIKALTSPIDRIVGA
jgi:hypothetical protein